jgi:hypothetical protein
VKVMLGVLVTEWIWQPFMRFAPLGKLPDLEWNVLSRWRYWKGFKVRRNTFRGRVYVS